MPPKKEEKQTPYVFVVDPDYGWRPGVQEKNDGKFAYVSLPNYKTEQDMTCDGGRGGKPGDTVKIDLKNYAHGVLPLQNVDSGGNLIEFADMVKLPYLHEAAILYNMKKRHRDGKPYTRTGDIVIAINPFQWFTELYTEKKRSYYSNRLVWQAAENDPRDGMEPHVYEVSSLSYKGLAFDQIDQSILVSGESGAGKTETVKICMNHIASVQQGPKSEAQGDVQELDPVVARVVQSNPLLEAYGNASTRRNDNSSRFGKYLQLQFDKSSQKGGMVPRTHSTCVLAGSKCDVYLLEKNRVTYHDTEERTYHIFYQILAAPEADKAKYWSVLSGKKNKDFKYVQDTKILVIEKMTDEQHYKNTVDTLAVINVVGDKLVEMMRAICVVMQCGNLTFGALQGDKDKSTITSTKELKDLAELMGVSEGDLTLAFTERTMKTKTETYKVPLNTDSAKEACDAFAKEVYGNIFLWVVQAVNAATCAEDNYNGGGNSSDDFGIIGLLDIFGFESFAVNRFEQLCINYANEKLQQKFTEDVFRAVQAEYEAEGIDLDQITYDDNTDVLDLIESRTGLLAMLNEECVRPKGNDQDFVQKALSQNKTSPCLITNKYDRMSFGVHHFAGKVMYSADGFVGSNQDTLPNDLVEIGQKSTNTLVANKVEQDNPEEKKSTRSKSSITGATVWGKYKTQLASLMGNLHKTSSRYIRCIKPNMAKKPVIMDHIPTVEQLRCAGVVAAVTVARSAFPNNLDNNSVRFRYGSMWDKKDFPSKRTDSMTPEEGLRCNCEAILSCALKDRMYKDKEGKMRLPFVVGKTKSYFKAGALEYLEANRATGLDSQAVTIQKLMRGVLARKRLGDMVKGKQQAEKEAREAKERAEREAKEKADAERQEREQKYSGEKKKYNDQIALLERQMKEADEYLAKKLKVANDRKTELEHELAELKEKTGEEARQTLLANKKTAATQKKKLEEQTNSIDVLKKENKKIRKEHEKIKAKWETTKETNENLLKQTEESGDAFDKNEDKMRKVDEKNTDLSSTLEKAKKDNKRLKDECMKKQDDYMVQAETRLEYQKTMARILNMIQDKVKEPQLVEETVCHALECEAESKSIMAALEAETELLSA